MKTGRESGLSFMPRGRDLGRRGAGTAGDVPVAAPGDQLSRAPSAREVISSTLPMPLMARYRGAVAGSVLAQPA